MPTELFGIRWIVEEYAQLDTAVPELRKVRGATISGIQIGRRVIWRKDDQRVEEFDQRHLAVGREAREFIAGFLRLAAVPQNHFHEIDAAPVVAVRSGAAHAPQRLRHKLRAQRAVVIALVKIRPQVVALEIGEDVLDQKRLEGGRSQRRQSSAVIEEREEWRRG